MKIVVLSLVTLLASQVTWASAQSVYTSIQKKDCRVVYDSETDPNAEIDRLDMNCSGVGGYKLKVSGADLRYSVSLISGRKVIRLSQYMGFHDIGSNQVEWIKQNGRVTALIHRIVATVDVEQSSSFLLVSKLNGANSCTVAEIAPEAGKNQNAEARAIALRAQSLPCL